ncbi:hypothetical protein [Streptomyces sp. NPDC046759]|uniref:hypothetical protein n=1 Tax=Streptomyces sp. NPDC046759 TaxID=3155019 RepID=UPI0033C7DE5D
MADEAEAGGPAARNAAQVRQNELPLRHRRSGGGGEHRGGRAVAPGGLAQVLLLLPLRRLRSAPRAADDPRPSTRPSTRVVGPS